jgi:hypothetical protein
MALIIRGQSKCSFCGKTLEEGQEIVGVPNFVVNELNELSPFSGTALHSSCYTNHPLSDRVERQLIERGEKIGPHNRLCDVCEKEIKGPDEFFMIDFLSDENADPMKRFNYIQIHWPSCVKSWNERDQVISRLREKLTSGSWKGNQAEALIKWLEEV